MTALVLLPGLDGTGELFADFAAKLPHELRVITVAYPSDVPLDYDALEPLMHQHLPIDEAFFLLAESFSGPLAARIAASAPTGLIGLILCCTFIKNPHPILAPLRPLVRHIPFKALPFLGLKLTHLGRLATPALCEKIKKIIARLDNRVLQTRLCAVLAVDASSELAATQLPILYLRARDDWVIFRSSAAHIVVVAPQTQVVTINAPHFMLQTRPTETARAVAEFIRATCSA